jgi:hypothetical protein
VCQLPFVYYVSADQIAGADMGIVGADMESRLKDDIMSAGLSTIL